MKLFVLLLPFVLSANVFCWQPGKASGHRPSTNERPETGIKEIVPDEFRERYRRWKDELLSTEFGRAQWSQYQNSDNFLLKIVVSSERKYGAGTGDFKWDESGRLVGATISIGKNLDKGFPDPVYYPVMNSLSMLLEPDSVKGNILASVKMAHELGHVNSTSQIDGRTFQHQQKLIDEYYKIFLNNGHDTRDPRLVKLAAELGRLPIEIWEDREYWGEANAMRFLISKLGGEFSYCSVIGSIMRNVSTYAKGYEDRFDEIAESDRSSRCKMF
jgi:hypothetical protein